jgi:hypothetical protein
VNPLDLIAICLVVAGAILGWRSGAIPQVTGLIGAIVGGVAVILALPFLVEPLDGIEPGLRPFVVLIGLVGAVAIGESIGASLGRAVANRLGTGFLSTRRSHGRVLPRDGPGTPGRVARRQPPRGGSDPAPGRDGG